MLWLVQPNSATTGKPHFGNRAPSRFPDFRTLDALLRKESYLRFQVIANEKEFVSAILIRWMECRFSWRQGKDQPVTARIHGFEPKNVAEVGAVRFRILSMDYNMSGGNHFSPSVPRYRSVNSNVLPGV